MTTFATPVEEEAVNARVLSSILTHQDYYNTHLKVTHAHQGQAMVLTRKTVRYTSSIQAFKTINYEK